MDRLPGDLWALLSKGSQRLAQQDAGSFCFHPLRPPRPGFACLRKLLIQLPNLACWAGCASIHLGNPGMGSVRVESQLESALAKAGRVDVLEALLVERDRRI